MRKPSVHTHMEEKSEMDRVDKIDCQEVKKQRQFTRVCVDVLMLSSANIFKTTSNAVKIMSQDSVMSSG